MRRRSERAVMVGVVVVIAPYLHKSHAKFGDSFPFPLPRKVRRNATQKHLSLDDTKTTKRGIQIEKIIIKLSASLSYKICKI